MSAFKAGALIERIKVNAISQITLGGRSYWLKRRRKWAGLILRLANGFLRAAGSPMRTILDLTAWQSWEVECFERLHGSGFRAFIHDPCTVAAEELPGINLTVPLDSGGLTPAMAAAAGRELLRAHACTGFAGVPWSHGDPHLGNFIYEAAADRARLIDFEVIHHPGLDAAARHSDDLLVFLQDMAGRIDTARWMPCARAFLQAYGRPEILALLLPQLQAPARPGLARLWWLVRTSYLDATELSRRFSELRAEARSS